MSNILPKSIPIKEFWLAIRTSDLAKLKELCRGVRLPTFGDSESRNHLLAEAMSETADISVLQFLVEHGVDPHELPRKGQLSPLDRAISMDRLDYIEFVLDMGVDPNKGLVDQRVTLSAVGSKFGPTRQLEILQRLIAHNVDLNFKFPLFGDIIKGFTVLDHATDEEVKAFLRSHGAKTAKELSGADQGADAAPADKGHDLRNEVIQYIQSLFGAAEAKSFTDILNADSGLTVHVIRPTTKEGFYTIFTTGLSLNRMDVPDTPTSHGYAELYMQLPGNWELFGNDPQFKWPIQLLLDLAAYPIQHGNVFHVPVTIITNGEPPEPLHVSVPFTASALLADKDFKRSDDKIVNLFCVMPVYQAEAEMALRHIPDFLNALDRSGVSRIFSPTRPSMVP